MLEKLKETGGVLSSSQNKSDGDVKIITIHSSKREIVHFQRFGEALRGLQDRLDSRNFYAFNPSFDRTAVPQGPGGCMRQGNA